MSGAVMNGAAENGAGLLEVSGLTVRLPAGTRNMML